LGLTMILGFMLFYFLLSEKHAALAEQNANYLSQVRYVEQLNKKLVNTNRELDDFGYVISHDLKEPIRGIEGIAGLLLTEYRDKLDDTATECISNIRESALRMRRLVDDLLRLSRASRRSYPYQDVNVNELVREVLETFRCSIQEKGAQVKVQDVIPTVTCDRVRFSEVLQNLISNALKFTNGKKPVVEIGHVMQGDEHLLWVQDNGLGIPKDDHKRVFGVFQRLHPEAQCDGTGVGLTICKRVIEQHGGRIWVESEPGKGTRLCLTLPSRPVKQDAPEEETVLGNVT
jgi:light-regulated signal transduction histidine kinase (bacteriophytochrome)